MPQPKIAEGHQHQREQADEHLRQRRHRGRDRHRVGTLGETAVGVGPADRERRRGGGRRRAGEDASGRQRQPRRQGARGDAEGIRRDAAARDDGSL